MTPDLSLVPTMDLIRALASRHEALIVATYLHHTVTHEVSQNEEAVHFHGSRIHIRSLAVNILNKAMKDTTFSDEVHP